MYAYFIGHITQTDSDSVVLEVNHIGYHIYMPTTSIELLKENQDEIKIYTYTCVREDAFMLYGFVTKEELNLFKLLITVSGIGPKGGLSILSVMDIDTLKFSILSQDAKLLSKAPGIGSKTANRMILELKDKINKDELLESITNGDNKTLSNSNINSIQNEAVDALVSLGYPVSDVLRTMKKIEIKEEDTTESLIKKALKQIM